MRIFNAPQDRAQSIVSQHNIENIISVYSPNKTFPLFPGVKSDQILRLCFNDINRPQNNLKIITMNDIKKIINFLEIEFKKVCLNRGYKSNVIKEVWMMISSFIGFTLNDELMSLKD